MMKTMFTHCAVAAIAIAACGGTEDRALVAGGLPVAIDPIFRHAGPQITSVQATPAEQTQPGGTIELAATVNDAGPIAYAWSDDCGGVFADKSSAATAWTAPAAPATCTVNLQVHETTGLLHDWAAARASITLEVVAPPAPPAPVVAYSTLPDPFPFAMTSQNYQAQATSELGELVTLEGSGRQADKATIAMVTYGPIPAYSYPITLNLYDPSDLTHPIATRTRTFDIPARPAADPTCPSTPWDPWRDSAGACHNGAAFTVVFDLTGITLPDSFVFGIAYDTQSWGAHPTGQDGYSNNLNVGLVPVASGTTTLYLNSSWAGAYQGGGNPGTFHADPGWSYHVAAKFTTKP